MSEFGGYGKGWRRRPGVAILRREGSQGTRWLARYTDPDTGKQTHETIPSGDAETDEARTRWAARRAAELETRGADVAGGAPTKKQMTLTAAFERYFEHRGAQIRPKTKERCEAARQTALEWATKRRVQLADELTSEMLADLREAVVTRPFMRRGPGGIYVASDRPRSPGSVRRELGALKTMLEHLRRLGLVPMLRWRDQIRDSLESPKLPKPVPVPLRPEELLKLIEATWRHDEDVFDLTREEHARGLVAGETRRYWPALPYLALLLLSGMRADEARLLRWDAVSLRAPGEILLRPEDVKTKHGRQVTLEVSPVLGEMLAAMKLRAEKDVFVFENRNAAAGEERTVTRATVESARKRLRRAFGAPRFQWKQLRVTCGTYLANAPGIFGAASAYREAKQLGHSVTVAERHYLGVVRVAPEARTVEAAMSIEAALRGALGLAKAKRRKIT